MKSTVISKLSERNLAMDGASRQGYRANRLIHWAFSGAVLVLITWAFSPYTIPKTSHGYPKSIASSPNGRGFFLKPSPDPVQFGVVVGGQEARQSLALVNWGDQPVMVERIETSCPCLIITPESTCIGPGETATVSVKFNPSAEPDFRGRLAIDVTGYTGDQTVFHTLANLDVRTRPPIGSDSRSAPP